MAPRCPDPRRLPCFPGSPGRVVGPLYGRQSIDGYDAPPDSNLSYASFSRFLLPFRFPYATSPWSGRYLTFEVPPAPLVRRGPMAV